MVTNGDVYDWETQIDHPSVPLGFWGEWEGPSVFWKVDSPGKPLPKIVHAPFQAAQMPAASIQNTDPMVFGDSMVYSNCLQATHPSLRELTVGSIVLFGRHARVLGQPSFSLDTCLVVDHREQLAPGPTNAIGTDLLATAVLGPLFSEGESGPLSVYFGQRRSSARSKQFSFFPARLMHESSPLFARPELSPTGALIDIINPGKMQGIKLTHLSRADRDSVWEEVVRQVTVQGCRLGHRASAPPVLEGEEASSASRQAPGPLG
jgi:hypothetical protein